MKRTKREQEEIALQYGYKIVEWDPLELEDPYGYVILRDAAKRTLNKLIYEYDTKMNNPILDKELEDVRSFHQKFGFLDQGRVPTMVTQRKLRERAECLQEELDEFKKAIETQDFPEQADALIDLVYFAKGTAVMMGLPWEALWDDVQRANISKERGVTKRGHAFDVIKPEGWQKPQGEAILANYGFDRRWFESHGVINENLCADDARRVVFKDVGTPTMIRYFTNVDGQVLGMENI